MGDSETPGVKSNAWTNELSEASRQLESPPSIQTLLLARSFQPGESRAELMAALVQLLQKYELAVAERARLQEQIEELEAEFEHALIVQRNDEATRLGQISAYCEAVTLEREALRTELVDLRKRFAGVERDRDEQTRRNIDLIAQMDEMRARG